MSTHTYVDEIIRNPHTPPFSELRKLCANTGAKRVVTCYPAFLYLVRSNGSWDHKPEISAKWGKDGLLDG